MTPRTAALLLLLGACAGTPRTDVAALVARLCNPADVDVERLLVDSGEDVESLAQTALGILPPDATLRLRVVLRARENRRLGPVTFLAGGTAFECDADGNHRRTVATCTRPDQTRHSEWRVVAVWIDGDEELVAMAEMGRGERRLTHEKGRDRDPAWSPDGERIAFVSERDGNAEIYLVNVKTLFVRRLTWSPGPDSSPRWSLDGSTVFFVTERDGRPQIYRVRKDGAELRRVSDGTSDDRFSD